jgi:tetratricopeptide (TPR) repeat protein
MKHRWISLLIICALLLVVPATLAQDAPEPDDCIPSNDYETEAQAAISDGNAERAAYLYACAIKIDPTNGDLYYSRGDVWYDLREWELLVADMTSAIELDPEIPARAWNLRAIAYSYLLEIDLAAADYTYLLEETDFDEAIVYNNLGWAYNRAGEYQLAAETYVTLTEIARDTPEEIIIEPGEPVVVTMTGTSAFDFVFEVVDGAVITMTATGLEGMDTTMVLIGPGDQPLIANDDIDADNDNFNSGIFDYAVPRGGAYALRVIQWVSDDDVGPVEVLIDVSYPQG